MTPTLWLKLILLLSLFTWPLLVAYKTWKNYTK